MDEHSALDNWNTVRTTLSLAGMVVVALIFAIFLFLPQSLRLDEAQSLWQVSRSPEAILTVVAEDVHVPLYHEVLHVWLVVIGDSIVSARALSLLFFLLSIPAIYMLGKLAYNSRVGLAAAMFFTLSPFMNWYGSEIRMYTIFVFFAIVNQYFFLRLLKKESDYAWIGYGLTAIIGSYVHYFFVLILLTEAVFYFMHRKLFSKHALRRLIIIAAALIVLFAPWAWFVLHIGQAANQEPHLAIPTTVDLFSVYSQFLFGFQIDPINTVLLSLWPVIIVLAFLALSKRMSDQPENTFFALSLTLPVAIAFAISFVVPLFVSRYLIFVAPSLYVFLSHVLSRYSKGLRWGISAALVVLIFFMIGTEVTQAMTPVKEDYRDAVEYIEQHESPQDTIIISAPFTIYPIEYYYHGSLQLQTLPQWNRYTTGAIPLFNQSTLGSQVQSETQNASYAWLILSYNQGYEANIKTYFDDHYALVYSHTFSPDLSLYEYKISYMYTISISSTTPK